MNIFNKKTFESLKQSVNNSTLKKNLTAFDLVLLGLGGIIGTGIFVLTGIVAAKYSGPAVMVSYILAGITCIFVALSYIELANLFPDSGSVYTYSYVAFGEIIAFVMAFIMVIELCCVASAVATGWSAYLQSILLVAGYELPHLITHTPSNGGIIDLPAVLIVIFVSIILILGNKESSIVNTILVFIKLLTIFIFIITAAPHFTIKNWDNFIPFGMDNVIVGASILFLAFTGFSNIATSVEECINPSKDVMIGIIGSLVIAIFIYSLVGGMVTGIVPFYELDVPQPLAYALKQNNSNIGSALVATGAICGMFSVIMINIYGISRIFYSVARDGLLPTFLTKLHVKYNTPYITIIIFSSIIATLAAFFPFNVISQLSSIGALIDYIVIILITLFLRIKRPEINRTFKCPAVFIIAPIGLISSLYLLFKQIIINSDLSIQAYVLFYFLAFVVFAYFVRVLYIRYISNRMSAELNH